MSPRRTTAVPFAVALALAVSVSLSFSSPARADATAPPKPAVDGGAALPPGHPPVGSGLPAGHPSIDDADPEDEAPQPKGEAKGRDPRFFEPPPDGASDDPSLPAGTLIVRLEDAQRHPLPHLDLELGILHSSVAKGDSHEQQAAATDGEGTARFDHLTVGSGTTYRVSVKRGPATFSETPFALSDKVGKRATLHVYEVGTNLEALFVGMQGRVHLTLREDSIQVEQLLTVFNVGAVAWAADVTVALPAGFKAFNKPDGMEEGRVEEVKGKGAALRGTFAPGRHDLNFRYQVPLDDEAKQTLRLELPPRLAQLVVTAEASKTMGLEVTGFPPSRRVVSNDGKRLLVTQKQAVRADGGLPALELTLTGLPSPGPGRWIAVALAAAALGAGLWQLRRGARGALDDDDAREDLREAREALLVEIVALERARKRGEVGPKTHERVRASLLDALARIVDKLDATSKAMTSRKPGGGAGARPGVRAS